MILYYDLHVLILLIIIISWRTASRTLRNHLKGLQQFKKSNNPRNNFHALQTWPPELQFEINTNINQPKVVAVSQISLSLVISNFSEYNEGLNLQRREEMVPGNISYKDVARYQRRWYAFGRSMVKGLRRKKFSSFTMTQAFDIEQCWSYVTWYKNPIINDDIPDDFILQIGYKDISNKRLSIENIAEIIIEIGRVCKSKKDDNSFICWPVKWLCGFCQPYFKKFM